MLSEISKTQKNLISWLTWCYFLSQYGGPHQQQRSTGRSPQTQGEKWTQSTQSRTFQGPSLKRPVPPHNISPPLRDPSPSRDDCPSKRSRSISSHQVSHVLFPLLFTFTILNFYMLMLVFGYRAICQLKSFGYNTVKGAVVFKHHLLVGMRTSLRCNASLLINSAEFPPEREIFHQPPTSITSTSALEPSIQKLNALEPVWEEVLPLSLSGRPVVSAEFFVYLIFSIYLEDSSYFTCELRKVNLRH